MYFHPQDQGLFYPTPENLNQDMRQYPGGGFPGGGFPGGGYDDFFRRLDRLERQVQRLDRRVDQLDRRLDRVERRLGLRENW